jgi:hypothetical protein
MITCAQSKATIYRRLNWLHLVVPQVLWNMQVSDVHATPYPNIPQYPDATPNYGPCGLFELQTAKDLHNKQNKDHHKLNNINTAPTDCFL